MHPSAVDLETGTLPNLIIIGAGKCGTTSLHYYLNLHPQISMSRQKELDFFIREGNWHKGIQWYKAQFTAQADVCGEASPKYTFYPLFNGAPQRMHTVVPEAKLVYVLRDPMERIISHYIHYYATGQENRTLTQALSDLDHNPYIWRSKYFLQLEKYLTFFSHSQILILTLEDLHYHPRETLKRIFRFLGVESFYSAKFSNVRHPSRGKRRKNRFGLWLCHRPGFRSLERLPPQILWHVDRFLYFPFSRRIERPKLDSALRQALIASLQDDIDRLRAYTGYRFEHWCL
jgi:hypothetical protein